MHFWGEKALPVIEKQLFNFVINIPVYYHVKKIYNL